MTEPEGKAAQLRCPYHGWTYSLEGELKGTPDFSGVCDFDRASNGLVPVELREWENWVFVKLVQSDAMSLEDFLGDRSGCANRAASSCKIFTGSSGVITLRLQLESVRR